MDWHQNSLWLLESAQQKYSLLSRENPLTVVEWECEALAFQSIPPLSSCVFWDRRPPFSVLSTLYSKMRGRTNSLTLKSSMDPH